jgi:hypothetical protein
LERKILTVWKRKFWQFEKENFDSLEWKILTVWKGKFWQFGREIFDSLKGYTVWEYDKTVLYDTEQRIDKIVKFKIHHEQTKLIIIYEVKGKIMKHLLKMAKLLLKKKNYKHVN